ncbi:MAG TPA: hypothetical protein VFC19_07880 [Candidatus Limnocylindrales bacterium]|nr:hypothetical protein [Candidatus Limnocylindrales bacterium]
MNFRTGLVLSLVLAMVAPASPTTAAPQAVGCQVVLPSTEATVSGMVTMSSAAQDAASVHYRLGGAYLGEARSTGYGWLFTPDGGRTWGWDSTTVANGRYALTCVAVSAGGQSATSAPVWINVANATGCEVVLPTGDQPVSGTATFSAAAHVTGTTKVEYYLHGKDIATIPLGQAQPTIYGWVLFWDSASVPLGVYRLTCNATGPGGARHGSPAVVLTVDNVTRHDWGSYCADHVAVTPADYQAAFDHRRGGWAGADGAQPIPLPDGRVIWLFGDTLAGQIDAANALLPGWRMPSNSVIVQSGTCFTPVMGGTPQAPREFLTDAAGNRFWPVNGYVDTSVTPAVLHIAGTQVVSGECGWFRLTGVRVFTLSLPALRVIADAPAPYNQSATNVPSFGTSLFVDGTHVYLYGDAAGFQCQRTDPGPYPAGRYVARTSPSRLASGPWQYWTGSAWSNDINSAAPMSWQGGETPWVQATMRHGDRYMSTSRPAPFGAFGPTVHAWFATSPTGPWEQLLSNGQPADIVPAGTGFPQGRWYYGGFLITPSLLVFSTNGLGCDPANGQPCTPDNDVAKNVMLYGPHFVQPVL